MRVILIGLFLALIGCSVKDNQSTAQKPSNSDPISEIGAITATTDSDGDMVPDLEEQKIGRNPKLADLPELTVRFLQNYKVIVKYKALKDGTIGEFVIDTKTQADDPDFKYRIGEIFIRNESFKNAGSIGKYSTHSWGEVEEHDLSWVSYPEVDPRFYSKKQLEFKKYLDPQNYLVEGISIILENSVRLKSNDLFKSIKDLTLNFYYYDDEKESYELVKTQKVERHFNAGINETFEVTLENLPLNLLVENYFRRGEFIISELGDFEIPDLETSYQKILSSVRAKSIPVIYNTPLESAIYYVGVDGRSTNFAGVLSSVFGSKATILDNDLIKINQFENSLPSFTYLSEVKNQDKKGKWFVFTNRLNSHYLDHKFTPKDIISLSYIMGSTLATQDAEKIVGFRENAISEGGSKLYPLGNVSPNSKIDIQLTPLRIWGENKKNISGSVNSPGGSCGKNCFSREYTCWHDANLFSPLDEVMSFKKDFSEELLRVALMVNLDEFELKPLVDAKKLRAEWIDGNLHLQIDDINAIKPLLEVDENVLALKLYEFKETTYNGIRLTNYAGRDWPTCIPMTINIAGKEGIPLSVDSKGFGSWGSTVRWDLVKRGDSKTYTRNFSVGISSIINNYFN